MLAQLGPKLIGVDLPAACAEYERQMGGGAAGCEPGVFSAYRAIEVRAYSIDLDSRLSPAGRHASCSRDLRIFVERVRRGDRLIEADGDTVLMPGDVVGDFGTRNKRCSSASSLWCEEVSDPGAARLAGDSGRRLRHATRQSTA